MIREEELDFLIESNNIESEYDDKSLYDAILAWQFIKNESKITPRLIKDLHAILMRTRTTIEKEDKGVFRNGTVYIGGREGKPWFALPELIENWCKDVNFNIGMFNDGLHLNVDFENIAKQHHVQYEDIHPFFDGNGRTGRILHNWESIQTALPILVIEEKKKYDYYEWFR